MAIQGYNSAPPRTGKTAPGTKRGIINSALRKASKHCARDGKTGRYCKSK